jgi:hypothetical protein
LLGAGVVGMGVGAVIGGGLLPRLFDWESVWTIDAPLADVYERMSRTDGGQSIWPSMQVERITPDATAADGRAVHYRVIQASWVARFTPPFRIVARMTVREPQREWRMIVTGDLAGVLTTHFSSTPEGGTRVVFHWYVRMTNPLLNLVGYGAEPAFRASHDHVMREGEAGLREYFAQRRRLPAL